MTAASPLPRLIATDRLRLRAATTDDAAFILSLRLDPERNQHLAPTRPNLDAQIAWMEEDSKRPNQTYYVIEEPSGEPAGAIRLDLEADARFAAHSLIVATDAPRGAAMEVALLVYGFALKSNLLGGRFFTRQANERAWRFFEKVGAVHARDEDDERFYEVSYETMREFVGEPNPVRLTQ
jgi:RimJ/RimL family protein N-acetyltransferase